MTGEHTVTTVTDPAVRELIDTADWLGVRALGLERLAERPASRSELRQALRDDAARLRGRALLIRQTAAAAIAAGCATETRRVGP